MKNIKKIIFICLIFFLTGCTANYNLKIDRDTMTEDITFMIKETTNNKRMLNRLKEQQKTSFYDSDERANKYYKSNHSKKNDVWHFNYTYQYTSNQLQYSSALEECYYNRSVINNDETIFIKTSDEVTCFYRDGKKQVDRITVNITVNNSDLKVINHNADNNKGNVYTWNITEANYTNKSIYIEIEKQKIKIKAKNKNESIILFIVIGIFVLVGIILAIIHKKNNSMK